jgi:hypothetical protein
MPKDVVVYVKIDIEPKRVDELAILLVGTGAEKPYKEYKSLEGIQEDYAETDALMGKARQLFNQPGTLAAGSQIRKAALVSFAETDPIQVLARLEELRQTHDDWYIFMTDLHSLEAVAALSAYAAASEPTESQLDAGVEDHRKLYFGQTEDIAIIDAGLASPRSAVIVVSDASEHADAAWVGTTGPWYPQSVTWKFKRPDGVAPPDLTERQKDALDEAFVNYLAIENKRVYVKNGVCLDGNFIDNQMGADYIAQDMRSNLYELFLANAKIPYTDAGFTLIGGGVFKALNRATDLGIIARNPESGLGVYVVSLPSRASASDEMAALRRMPDISWDALLEGAVHGVKTSGRLRVNL